MDKIITYNFLNALIISVSFFECNFRNVVIARHAVAESAITLQKLHKNKIVKNNNARRQIWEKNRTAKY